MYQLKLLVLFFSNFLCKLVLCDIGVFFVLLLRLVNVLAFYGRIKKIGLRDLF